jgi:hypothetical protein
MGDSAKGRDKGKAKKKPTVKPGRRPHELRQQAIDANVRAAS